VEYFLRNYLEYFLVFFRRRNPCDGANEHVGIPVGLASTVSQVAEDAGMRAPDRRASARVMTNDLEGIEAQARDISFLIGYARTLPDVEMSEIAVAGFSWGGISNLFAAARDNRIDALVALDGSMRYYPGLVKNSGYLHPEEMTLPLLFFTQGAISLEEQAKDFTSKDNEGPNVLNRWTHGDLITVDDMALTHVEHSSMYQRNEKIWKHYPENRKGRLFTGRWDCWVWVGRSVHS